MHLLPRWRIVTRLLVYFASTWLSVFLSGQGRADEIPLGSNGGVYTVPVVVNGSVKIPFIVDSGASSVVIPEDVFRILLRGGTLSQSDALGSAMVTLADGTTQRRMRVRLREVRIGSYSAENVVAIVSPQNADPLLGQSFLSRFGAVSFDYQRHVLVLSGPGSAPAPSSPTASLPIIPSAPFVGPLGAGRFGAFALDELSGKYGFSSNEASQPAAEYSAVRGCNSAGCKIVFKVGPKRCGAIALTDDGKIWGGAERPTKAGAELAAMQNCQKRTRMQCRLRGAECNG